MKISTSMIASLCLALSFALAPTRAQEVGARRPHRLVDDARLLDREASALSASSQGGTSDLGGPQATSAVAGSAIPNALAWLASRENSSGSWGIA